MYSKTPSVLIAITLAALALTACGGGGGSHPPAEVGGAGRDAGGGGSDPGEEPDAPLAFSAQPQPTFSEAGLPARFAVQATGPAGLSFQWQRATAADASNFVDIPGATAAGLTLAAPQPADDGALFRVVVGSAAQRLASAAAKLTVVGRWSGVAALSSNAGRDHKPAAIAVDARGRVLVVGRRSGDRGSDGLVLQQSADGRRLAWGWLFGVSPDNDIAFSDVASDAAGDVYVVGRSDVSLQGMTIAGGDDAVLLKLSGADGRVVWARSLGTGFDDAATAVAVDAATDAVYVAGYAGSQLPGADAHAGGFDAFVARYGADGQRLWVRQFGSALDDGFVREASGLAPRAVAGPAVHLALDAAGLPVVAFTRQIGNVGQNSDVVVARFGADGAGRGASQAFNMRRNDRVARVAVTAAGEIVVAGVTEGETPAGGLAQDVFVLRLSATLGLVSRRIVALAQNGLTDALISGLAVDAQGNAYVAAHAEPFSGVHSIAWMKVDATGNQVWMQGLGGEIDSGGIAVDRMGRLFLVHQDDGVVVRRLRPEDGFDHP